MVQAFVERSNAESLVCVQLEHAEAIDNLDEILAVEDIDVFFLGPSDLSQSMGYPGDPGAAPVAAAIDSALRKIAAAGRVPGMPAAAERLEAVLDSGARYIYTHLPRLVGAGAGAYLSRAGKP